MKTGDNVYCKKDLWIGDFNLVFTKNKAYVIFLIGSNNRLYIINNHNEVMSFGLKKESLYVNYHFNDCFFSSLREFRKCKLKQLNENHY